LINRRSSQSAPGCVVFARYTSHRIEDFSTATNTETDVQTIDFVEKVGILPDFLNTRDGLREIDWIKQFDRSDVRVARWTDFDLLPSSERRNR